MVTSRFSRYASRSDTARVADSHESRENLIGRHGRHNAGVVDGIGAFGSAAVLVLAAAAAFVGWLLIRGRAARTARRAAEKTVSAASLAELEALPAVGRASRLLGRAQGRLHLRADAGPAGQHLHQVPAAGRRGRRQAPGLPDRRDLPVPTGHRRLPGHRPNGLVRSAARSPGEGSHTRFRRTERACTSPIPGSTISTRSTTPGHCGRAASSSRGASDRSAEARRADARRLALLSDPARRSLARLGKPGREARRNGSIPGALLVPTGLASIVVVAQIRDARGRDRRAHNTDRGRPERSRDSPCGSRAARADSTPGPRRRRGWCSPLSRRRSCCRARRRSPATSSSTTRRPGSR